MISKPQNEQNEEGENEENQENVENQEDIENVGNLKMDLWENSFNPYRGVKKAPVDIIR